MTSDTVYGLLVDTAVLLVASMAVCLVGEGAEPHRWPKDMRGVNIILSRITEADLDHLADDWQANSVRLMTGRLISEEAPYSLDTAGLQRMYDVVDWCRKRGLYVVINLGQPAGRRQSDHFWQDSGLQAGFVGLWKTIAAKYADSGTGVAYDLMNEPHGKGSVEVWPGLARQLTETIREVDSVHPIVVEPAPWGNAEAFVGLEPVSGDGNTVYSFHFYHPFDFTHQRGAAGTLQAKPEDHPLGLRYPGRIKAFWEDAPVEDWNRATIQARVEPVVEFGKKHGVPIWCGEFGCTRWADGAHQYLSDCLQTWEESGIGWCYYSYREWYAMDLEMGTQGRSREAPRHESELVKLFKRYFARNPSR